MPGFEKVNSKVVRVPLTGTPAVARRGAMLAYTGDVRFVPHGMPGGMGGGLGAAMGGMAGRLGAAMSGEHVSMMATEGTGEVFYGHLGLSITIIEVTPGQTLQVEADRLLVHDASLQASTVFIGQGGIRQAVRGAMTGQGLFTTALSGQGTLAVLSHGGTFTLKVNPSSPVFVDPQAFVASAGNVQVDVTASVGWRDAVGKGSGEAVQLKVTGDGSVYVQASERKL